jgi:hypothetical protein
LAVQRVPVPLIGGSEKASSSFHESGRAVNLYMEQINGKWALKHVPGFFRWLDITAYVTAGHEIRGMHVMAGRLFCVVGNQIGEVYPTNVIVFLATLSTFTGRVGMADLDGKLVVGDGTGFFVFDFDTSILSPVLNDGEEAIRGYICRALNSQMLYFERDSSTYHYSAINDPATVEGLSFFSAESSPDYTINAHVVGDQITILGTDTTEGHYNSGDADNPFQRISGAVSEYGSVGRWANCKFDNTVVMVGRNADGGGKVLRLGAAGASAEVISSPAVEKAIEKVLFAYSDVTERITMFAQEDAGHRFAFLNLPEVPETVNNPLQPSQTWVFDAATRLWHERGYMNPETGRFERILSDHHVYWRNRHYTGAYDFAHIYEMSRDYFRENTDPLVKWVESSGPLNMGGRLFTIYKLGIEMEVGVGRDAGVQGSEPLVIIRGSWDAGKTWSEEIPRSIGPIGDYDCRVETGPMGSGHNFVLNVICSEPVRITYTGAWADVSVHR